jgi:hypothetical protein
LKSGKKTWSPNQLKNNKPKERYLDEPNIWVVDCDNKHTMNENGTEKFTMLEACGSEYHNKVNRGNTILLKKTPKNIDSPPFQKMTRNSQPLVEMLGDCGSEYHKRSNMVDLYSTKKPTKHQKPNHHPSQKGVKVWRCRGNC